MPLYACIYATKTMTKFDSRKDARILNEYLELLQRAGARIVDVKVSIGGSHSSAHAVYLIIYEADKPIEC